MTSSHTAYGHFFTPDKDAAEYYGTPIEIYIKAKNPIYLDEVVNDGYMSSAVKSTLEPFIEDYFDGDDEQFMEWLGSGDLYTDNKGNTQDALINTCEGAGYDCVVFYDAKGGGGIAVSYVVINPKNIKASTSKNFDDTDQIYERTNKNR